MAVKIYPFFFLVVATDHSGHAEEFRSNLEAFRLARRAQMPQLSSIDLAVEVPVTASSLSPGSVAGGGSGSAEIIHRVDVDCQDELLPSEMYVEGRLLGRGGNGTVNEFFAVRDWARYAGKRVRYEPSMAYEVDMLKKLTHVRPPSPVLPFLTFCR